MHFFLSLLALLFFSPSALAAFQDAHATLKAVETYVKSQTAGLPGIVEISVGTIDPRLQLARCDKLDMFIPSGGKLWGNSTVGIRCDYPSPWSIYVPVNVRVITEVIVSSKQLAPGVLISAGDLAKQPADLTQLPNSVMTMPEQAIGKTLTSSVPQGYILRMDMLRSPNIIMQGQTVKLITQGKGFTVSAEGKALGNASFGQTISVRTPSGQVITGIAKQEGIVEIPF